MSWDTYQRVQQCRHSLSFQPAAAALFPAPVRLRVSSPAARGKNLLCCVESRA
jgi:hypothetical protein